MDAQTFQVIETYDNPIGFHCKDNVLYVSYIIEDGSMLFDKWTREAGSDFKCVATRVEE
jgi:hypothetical protein